MLRGSQCLCVWRVLYSRVPWVVNLEFWERREEKKYILPDGREITIKSAGPEDAMKVKFHREATSAETHFMAREPEGHTYCI